MNNKLLTGAALTIMAGLLLAGGTTVMAGNGGTPYVNSEGGCVMFDRSYQLTVYGDKTHVTVATSGNNSVKCQISAAESGLGAADKAVRYSGFTCVADGILTNKTTETIDNAGNVTMTCQYKKE